MEIEKKNVYVKLDPEETIKSKKALLKITESIIKMMIISRNFKSLLSKESSSIERWTKNAEEISDGVENITGILPKEEPEAREVKIVKKGKKEKTPEELTEDEKLDRELRKIQESLSKLS